MSRRAPTIRVLLLALLLAGCSRYELRIQPDPSVDVTRFRTWAWLPGELCEPADQRLPDRYIDRKLREAAARVLRKRGYEPAGDGTPDFWLNYRLTSDDASRYYVPRGYGLAQWSRWDRAGVDTYDEGTLILDAIEVAPRELVWRGSASARLLPHISLEKRAERVEDVIEKILGEFPARAGGSR
jgi:hypothetical protein